MPEQTARLLQVLLERSNSLVSRDEIEQVLWPDEQYVNHDQGINVAINRLRQILRDNSKNPQFLKTIPKRGYSFCGEVRVVPGEIREEHPSEETSYLLAAPAISSSSALPVERDPPAWIIPLAETAPLPLAPAPQIIQRRLNLALVAVLAIVVLLVAGAGIALWRRSKPVTHPLRVGIAPLRAGDDPEARETAESFRLQLSDAVSRLPGIQVPATGAFISARAEDIPRIARELNLDELLIGSISRQQDGYDLKFELVRATDATHLDSFEFSGLKKDLPAICDTLQQDIFHHMQHNTAPLQSSKGSTNDAEAYEYYLQGEYSMLERSQESLRNSLTDFDKAIGRDPNFALAYAGAATAYLKLSEYDSNPRNGLLSRAEENAQKAIKLDAVLSQAHAVLGVTAYKQDRDFARGEAELREAIRIDPSQAGYRNWIAVLLVDEGRFDESMAELTQAENNAPFWPSVYAMEGLVGVYARQDAVAIKAARHYVDLLPNLPIAHNTMAWILFETRHYEEAIREWRQMAMLQGDAARADLENRGLETLRSKGVRAYAQLRLNAIQEKRGISQVNDFMPAEWYACAGKREQALNELERLAADKDPFILHIGVDPLYDSLHQEPRFLAILSRSGLAIPPALQHADSHLCEQ